MQEKKSLQKVDGLPNAVQLTSLLEEETKRQNVLDSFINTNLKEDIDYGIIPGTGTKPTLLKPGAEKVLSLFNLRAEWGKDTDTLEMINIPGAVAFECKLVNRSNGEIVGEGRGVAIPNEKKSWNANTQVKICEKRALVDAVLSTFALSSRYTQDIEDMTPDTTNGSKTPYNSKSGQPVASYVKDPDKPASEPQKYKIKKQLEELKNDEEWLKKQINEGIDTLKMGKASKVIEQLQAIIDTRSKKTAQQEPQSDIPIVCSCCNEAVSPADYVDEKSMCKKCVEGIDKTFGK